MIPTTVASIVLGLTNLAPGQTRIMCVGDSITGGWGPSVSTFHASYRYPLWFDLQEMGYDVEFVGPFNDFNGPGCTGGQPGLLYPLYNDPAFQGGRHHAAICGASTTIILNEIQGWLEELETQDRTPQIIMIHVGGRDVGVLGASGVDNADANLRSIIDIIRTAQPSIHILLAQITPIASYSSYGSCNSPLVQWLNERIERLVTEKNQESEYPPVILVDQYTGFDLASMMQADGIHPNTAGEQRMADVWREALYDVLGSVPSCRSESVMPSANTLMALYTFDDGTIQDGNAQDVSVGNNRTCTGAGTPQFVSAGFDGDGLELNGSSWLWADVPIRPIGHPKLTMGAWVKLPSVGPSSFLLSHDNGGWDRAVGIGPAGWTAFTGTGVTEYLPITPQDWQFVAVVFDDITDDIVLYVDGEHRTATGSPGTGDNYLQIGHSLTCSFPPCTPLTGTIDNVFILSEALSVPRLAEIKDGGYHRIPSTPVFIRQPECSSICLGSTAIFEVDVAASALDPCDALNYRWRKEGQEVAVTEDPHYTIANVSLLDMGMYDCVASNGCGSATSHAVQLTVSSAPGNGDGNGDGKTDGLDIAGFVNAVLAGPSSAPPALCAYDIDSDDTVSTADVPLFINLLLGM